MAGSALAAAPPQDGQRRSTSEHYTPASSVEASNNTVASGADIESPQPSASEVVPVEQALHQLEIVVAQLSAQAGSALSTQASLTADERDATHEIAKLSAQLRRSLEQIGNKYQITKKEDTAKTQLRAENSGGGTDTQTGSSFTKHNELPLDEVMPIAAELELLASRVQKLIEILPRTAATREPTANGIGTAFSELAKTRLQAEVAKIWNNQLSLEAAPQWKVCILRFIHGILAIGVIFASFEFYAAWKIRAKATDTQNHIEVGRERIALRTALHGTLIFTLTLLTYFLAIALLIPLKLL